MGVIPPNRRSTAKAFFHLISHCLGDAPAPLIVGGLADIIHKYEYDGKGNFKDETLCFNIYFRYIFI